MAADAGSALLVAAAAAVIVAMDPRVDNSLINSGAFPSCVRDSATVAMLVRRAWPLAANTKGLSAPRTSSFYNSNNSTDPSRNNARFRESWVSKVNARFRESWVSKVSPTKARRVATICSARWQLPLVGVRACARGLTVPQPFLAAPS